MSVADHARLDDLRRRLADAVNDFLSVDAVVVYRPDLRRKDADRLDREHGFSFAVRDPAGRAGTPSPSIRFAAWAEWQIPPGEQLDEYSGQVYRRYGILDAGTSPAHEMWELTLFGPPAYNTNGVATRQFTVLAHEATRLILRGNGKGNSPCSGWLLHLADRDVPLQPSCRRKYLAWPPQGDPWWVPATPENRPPDWWACRLSNVFWLSQLAVEEALEAAGARASGEGIEGSRSSRNVGAPLADESAYRPASEFVDRERFPNLKAVNKALEENPDIRRRRPLSRTGQPIPNRLEIHAGDWHAFRARLAREAPDPLDCPAGMADKFLAAVQEVKDRTAQERQRRAAD
jgi:hypothetical protein